MTQLQVVRSSVRSLLVPSLFMLLVYVSNSSNLQPHNSELSFPKMLFNNSNNNNNKYLYGALSCVTQSAVTQNE